MTLRPCINLDISLLARIIFFVQPIRSFGIIDYFLSELYSRVNTAGLITLGM